MRLSTIKVENVRSQVLDRIDEDGYGVYNYGRSVYEGEFVWEEADIYVQIDEENEKLMQLFKKGTPNDENR